MTQASDNIVELHGVSFKQQNRVIFDQVDIQIPRGKIVAIMGPSGSGKTTLLRLISGQISPRRGDVLVNGENLANLGRKQIYELRKQMGLLFQSGALFSDLSVFDNVAFPLREHTNLNEELIRLMVLLKLEAVGLRGAHRLMPRELSGGMQRRVALARTLALDPQLIMYDEPFAGQDPISMAVLVKLIKLFNTALGLSTIIVSHDVPETCSIADYIYVIAEGKIMCKGTPQEITNSSQAWAKQFMQGLPDGPVAFHYPAPDYMQDLIEG